MNIGSLIASLGVDTSGLAKAQKEFANFGQKIGTSATAAGKNFSLKVTVPIVAAATLATKKSIDFESAFTGVRKTVEATEGQLQKLKTELLGMARQVPLATEEIFGIAEAAGQLGIKTEDITKFTKVMADLGATTNLSANEAATSLARFANIVGLSSDDFDKLGSTIVHLGNNLATTERDITEMGLRLAGAGKTVGLLPDQILSLAGALSSVGIEAEAGGTAFSRVMIEIDKQVGTGSSAIKRFAEVSGLSVAAFEKQWKENAAIAIVSFTEGLGKIQASGENVNNVLEELGFSNIRVSDALRRAAGAGELFRNSIKLGNQAWIENTALTKEANLRYGTTASQLTIAKNKALQLAASFGDAIAPALIKVIDAIQPLVDWFAALDQSTKTTIVIIAGITAAIGPLLIGFGLMASAIGSIVAISSPVLLTVAAITASIVLLGYAAYEVVKNWEPIKAFFVDLWDSIANSFDMAIALIKIKIIDFFDLGRSIINGIIEGIKSGTSWLIQSIVNAATSALNAAKAVLGISSPSKLFAESIGKPIVQGIAQGITGNLGLVNTALASIPTGIGDRAGDFLGNSSSNNQTNNNQQYTVNYNGSQGRNLTEDEFSMRRMFSRMQMSNARISR